MTLTLLFRISLLFVLPNALFATLALSISPTVLIATMNSALASLALGVCVAYSPNIISILTEPDRQIDRADLLALGIFCSWGGAVLGTLWSLTWRFMGQPDEWLDTHLISYIRFLSVCGALFHLLAPAAVGNHIPTIEWLKIGALSAAGLMTLFLLSWQLNLI